MLLFTLIGLNVEKERAFNTELLAMLSVTVYHQYISLSAMLEFQLSCSSLLINNKERKNFL